MPAIHRRLVTRRVWSPAESDRRRSQVPRVCGGCPGTLADGYSGRQRVSLPPATCVQTIGSPACVLPRAPAGEQTAPSVTPWMTAAGAVVAGALGPVVGALVGMVVGGSSSSSPQAPVRADATSRMQRVRRTVLMGAVLPPSGGGITRLPGHARRHRAPLATSPLGGGTLGRARRPGRSRPAPGG